MFEYFLKRVLNSIPTVLAVVIVVFSLIHIAPGDPVDILVGENATPVVKKQIEREYGLDKPIHVQAFLFFKNLIVNGGGESIYFKKPCFKVVFSRFKNTFKLAMFSFVIAVFFSFVFAFILLWRKGGVFYRMIVFLSTIGMSLPSFWLGILLILFFSVKLKLLPVSGTEGFRHIILPSLTLAIPMGCYLLHIIRGEIESQMSKRFVLSLRTRGIKESLIFFRHVLKNSLVPVIMVLALQLGFLLTGAIITETIFSFNGIGLLLVTAINVRDYSLVQSLAIFIAVIYIYSNILGDVLIAVIDRRVSFEKKDI